MNPLQTVRVALRAILLNKLRSFLTTLGVIIGVAAVLAAVAIGEGAKARVAETFASMGSNLLILMPGTTTSGGSRGGAGSMPTLTYDDLAAIQEECSAVRLAAPTLRSTASVVGDEQNWTTQVQGTTPAYFDIREWRIAMGANFTQAEVDGGAKVAVLGKTVAEKLFPSQAEALGATVRIKNIPFAVIGVLARKGQSPMGQDYDDTVFVPLKTFQTKIQGGLQKYLSGTVFVGADSPTNTARAEVQIRRLLRDRHHLPEGVEDDFFIRNLTEIAEGQEASTRIMTALLAGIGGLSLLVGGIGIMNIMLVSVTERTREIGLRMAVGATPLQIRWQFLVEALTLSMAGGVIGIALGIGGAMLLSYVLTLPLLIRPDVALIAVSFSAMVGMVFGLYPAHKASQLDPIDALRYE
jgi:putative ABC transport system permease protein